MTSNVHITSNDELEGLGLCQLTHSWPILGSFFGPFLAHCWAIGISMSAHTHIAVVVHDFLICMICAGYCHRMESKVDASRLEYVRQSHSQETAFRGCTLKQHWLSWNEYVFQEIFWLRVTCDFWLVPRGICVEYLSMPKEPSICLVGPLATQLFSHRLHSPLGRRRKLASQMKSPDLSEHGMLVTWWSVFW